MYIENFCFTDKLSDDMNGFYVGFDVFAKKIEKLLGIEYISLDDLALNVKKIKEMKKNYSNFVCLECKSLDEIALANAFGFDFCIVSMFDAKQASKMAEFYLYDIKLLINQKHFDSCMAFDLGVDGVNMI